MTDPSPKPSSSPRPPVQYRGDDLDAERGPGLGCFYLQMIVLGILLVLTPVSVSMGASSAVSAILLFATLGVLLVSGQTIIFLLRLVAAERREGRRRPLASGTRTVGEMEDAAPDEPEAPTEPEAPGEPEAPTEPEAPGEPIAAAEADGPAPAAPAASAGPVPSPAEAAPPPASGEGPVRQ